MQHVEGDDVGDAGLYPWQGGGQDRLGESQGDGKGRQAGNLAILLGYFNS